MHINLTLLAIAWIVPAIVGWLFFYYTIGNKPSDIAVPPLLLIAAFAFWPITIVAFLALLMYFLIFKEVPEFIKSILNKKHPSD